MEKKTRREKRKKQRHWRHIRASMIKLLIPSKRYQQDKFIYREKPTSKPVMRCQQVSMSSFLDCSMTHHQLRNQLFIVSIDSSHQYLSGGIESFIIGALVYLRCLILSFFSLSSLVFFSHVIFFFLTIRSFLFFFLFSCHWIFIKIYVDFCMG